MNMTADEKRREKARQMRYKKPIVKDLNFDSIRDYLYEIQEACEAVRWYCEDEDTLIDALDGDEDEAFEFKMMFSDLDAECEQMLEDMETFESWSDATDLFGLFFVAVGAADDYGGLLGYDSYEQDYYGLDDDHRLIEHESRKKIERLTKKEIIDAAAWCFRIYQSFISLRYRYDCLKASLDILQEKNNGHIQMVRQIEQLYDRAEMDSMGFKYRTCDSVMQLDHVISAIPAEMWVW